MPQSKSSLSVKCSSNSAFCCTTANPSHSLILLALYHRQQIPPATYEFNLMIMANATRIDHAKQRYSRQLAAYTMEQWNIARSLMEAAEASRRERRRSRDVERARERSSTTSRSRSQPPRSHSMTNGDATPLPRANGKDIPNIPSSVNAVDYATRAPAMNGVANRAS